jgi:hypothetical protein
VVEEVQTGLLIASSDIRVAIFALDIAFKLFYIGESGVYILPALSHITSVLRKTAGKSMMN